MSSLSLSLSLSLHCSKAMDFLHKFLGIALPPLMLIVFIITLVPFLFLKFLYFLKRSKYSENVAGKVILITGASSGIGEVCINLILLIFCRWAMVQLLQILLYTSYEFLCQLLKSDDKNTTNWITIHYFFLLVVEMILIILIVTSICKSFENSFCKK